MFWATLLVVALVAGGVALLSLPASAQNATNISDVAPYYANESGDVNNASWYADVDENASLDSMGQMASRIQRFIGTGEMDPSGTGFQGVLLTGFVMIGMFVGAWAMLPVGSVGGGVLAVVVGYGMTELGLAPQWFRVVLVFAIGMVAYVAYKQAQQGR